MDLSMLAVLALAGLALAVLAPAVLALAASAAVAVFAALAAAGRGFGKGIGAADPAHGSAITVAASQMRARRPEMVNDVVKNLPVSNQSAVGGPEFVCMDKVDNTLSRRLVSDNVAEPRRNRGWSISGLMESKPGSSLLF